MRWGLLLLAGCTGKDSPPGAIEITGYLDASRVAWTWTGERALAAGLPEAASAGSTVELFNEGSQQSAQTAAGEDGAFAVTLAAKLGDALVLRVDGAAEEDTAHHEVAEPPPFPDHVHIGAWVDPHEHDSVTIEVQLDPPRDDGRIWVINQDREESAVTLDIVDHGSLHGGHLHGAEGDALLLWFVPDEGMESLPLEVSVGPAQ